MGRFRALLVGVADYVCEDVRSLPFVRNDIAGLAVALEQAGYIVDTLCEGLLGRTPIMQDVAGFIDSSASGDMLFVYLSGHGVHSNDMDYLVPSDADPAFTPLSDICVPVSYWAARIEHSMADQVLFFVDACREGFQQQTMAAFANARWGEGEIKRVGERPVAYVFACSPGGSANFIEDKDKKETYSVFSRALQEAIADHTSEQTLADLVQVIDENVARITTARGTHRQRIRVRAETDSEMKILVFPRSKREGSHRSKSWADLAANHEAWKLVPQESAIEDPRPAVIALVRRMHEVRRIVTPDLASDPWHDPELPVRVTERVNFLLSRAGRGHRESAPRLVLSPAEAALLVISPFLDDTLWSFQAAKAAATVEPAQWSTRQQGDQVRAEFDRYAQNYPRLIRRMTAARPTRLDTASQIGWWLLHRWIRQRPSKRRKDSLTELLSQVATDGLAADLLDPQSLTDLLGNLRVGPGLIARPSRLAALKTDRTVAAGTTEEQHVRERLIGNILTVARAMAIDARDLPEVLVEHIGVADPVSLPELHQTIQRAIWTPQGGLRVLNANCTHPAVEIALRAHAELVDKLLAESHKITSDGDTTLTGLPTHATAEGVRAAGTDDRTPYQSAGVRFQLAEDQVQELLMGEQLYGDTSLAIRELYQNALDACRYRRARTEYLERSGNSVAPWEGRITFRQGIDEQERPYMECSDNGIGMGIQELTAVFSQAGIRFVDTIEFREEQDEWERVQPPVSVTPTSRFGIGVLSYFMLADEITIETCRFGRRGELAKSLQVSIAGPGTLFRIREGDSIRQSGTTVRLYMRADTDTPSCVNLLRDILWIAEFHTEATNDADSHTWLPNQLSTAARLGCSDPRRERAEHRQQEADRTVVAAPNGCVWWCNTAGAVLVDGIWLTESGYGAIIDLRDKYSPRLSVNRTQILGDPTPHLDELLRDALTSIAAPGNPILTHNWLCRFAVYRPSMADHILEAAIDAGFRQWPEETATNAMPIIGCFPPDEFIDVIPLKRWLADVHQDSHAGSLWPAIATGLYHRSFPLEWRLAAWALAGTMPPHLRLEFRQTAVVRARPSDAALLSSTLGAHLWGRASGRIPFHSEWLDAARPVAVGHVVAAAAVLEQAPHEVVERLRDLGYTVPDHPLPDRVVATDKILLSRQLDGARPWLDPTKPVAVRHILGAALTLDWAVDRVVDRLSELGFIVSTENESARSELETRRPSAEADNPSPDQS